MMKRIHGEIEGVLMDNTQDALRELRNSVFGNSPYMNNPVHMHYHDTLNNQLFHQTVYTIKQKLNAEFFSRDIEGIAKIMKQAHERLQRPRISRRNR